MSQSGRYTDGGGGGGGDIMTITGNDMIAVGPDGAGNIDLLGLDPIAVSGNAGTNTLTITVESATTSQIGVVILATSAETITGTDTTKAIVPSGLTAKLGIQTQFAIPYGNTTSGAFQWTSAATDGQLLIGATGAAPAFASLTSTGGSIVFTPGANSLNLESTGGGIMWVEVTAATQNMSSNVGYIANNAGGVTFTLPASPVVGDVVKVVGKEGGGGWTIEQNAGQTIYFGDQNTTTGVTGNLSSTDDHDAITLVCTTDNTQFTVLSSIGNITVV